MYKKILLYSCALFLLFSSLKAGEKTVGILVSPRWRGEYELAKKMEIAAKNIGWNAKILNKKILTDEDLVDYDFVIGLTAWIPYYHTCSNYLCIMDPFHWFSIRRKTLKTLYQGFDGYLYTVNEKRYTDQLNPKHPWYPSSQYVPFNPDPPKRLFHLISSWGQRKNSTKFRQFYILLDQLDNIEFYGSGKTQPLAPKHHHGSIPFDGHSCIERQQEAGIVLIFHSHMHLNYGLPSGRIFEAAAASAVIISDLNPFIIEHFGDSVLYVDQKGSAIEMASTVKQHLKWIEENPTEAKALAKRAHDIFSKHFTLESQLLSIEHFHDELQANKAN